MFRSRTILYVILTSVLFLGIGTDIGYALDEVSAVEIAKNFVEKYPIFGINHAVIEDVSQIPVSPVSSEAKVKEFSAVVSPPKLITSSPTVVQLYTWSKHQGLLLEWKLEITGNKVRKVEIKSLGFGIGDCILTFEGPLLPPGATIVDFIDADQQVSEKFFGPKVEVDDHWVEINLNDPSRTESVNITVSGFGANENVNITITIGSHDVARLQVRTDNSGRGTVLFTPNQNTYTGRCRIEARSPSGSAVLEITDQIWKHDKLPDLNPSNDERGGLTLEKVYERTITDRFGNQVTFKVHFTDQTLDATGQTYDLPREILNEVVRAYRTQVEDWGFNRHLGVEYDEDGIVNVYVHDGQWEFHGEGGPENTYAVDGPNRIIAYQANLEQILTSLGIYFGGVDHIIAHEHFHGIQYAYTQWKWGDQGDWYIEGTARFIETIMDAADTYNPNSLFYSFRYISPQHYMLNPDRQLTEFSYDYALFWGYLYAHDGGFSTIEQIFEEIRNTGIFSNPETDGPSAISRVLARVSGEHDSFEELIKDFHIAVYTKNLTWNGYNWGNHLLDVWTVDISFTGRPNSSSDSVNKWAADYYKINIENPQADNFYYKLEYPLLQLAKDFWSALILVNDTGSVSYTHLTLPTTERV